MSCFEAFASGLFAFLTKLKISLVAWFRQWYQAGRLSGGLYLYKVEVSRYKLLIFFYKGGEKESNKKDLRVS